MNGSINVRELLALAEQSMASTTSARLDAEILLASSMNTDRARLYAYPEQDVPEDTLRVFQRLLDLRQTNYPIAYLTGIKEFWSLELDVNEHTLIPRPETECLVEYALALISKNQPVEILDIGTGSGAIALAIAAERPESRILAIDLSQEALVTSRTNARKHKLANIEFLQSDWFSELQDKQFHFILSNPPYVESADAGFSSGEIKHEPRLALDGGANGMQAITQLITQAMNYLKPRGHIFVEHGYQQALEIRQMFKRHGYREITTRQDYAGLDRVSFAQWP